MHCNGTKKAYSGVNGFQVIFLSLIYLCTKTLISWLLRSFEDGFSCLQERTVRYYE